MHPAIRIASVAALSDAAPAAPDDAPTDAPSAVGRAKALARRAGGAVLDRVGDRAAAATSAQLDQLREELVRTRAELTAEIELLRAELDGADPPRRG